MDGHGADGVLLTGVYGSGKSSVGAEIAYLLEQGGEPDALLDLDYLSWAGTGSEDRTEEFGLMLANLTAVAGNYREAGIRRFVLAYFVRDLAEVRGVREAAASLAAGEGAGVEDVLIGNDRPVGVVAREVLDFLGWGSKP